jgi:hypothetical protein
MFTQRSGQEEAAQYASLRVSARARAVDSSREGCSHQWALHGRSAQILTQCAWFAASPFPISTCPIR